LKSLAEIDCFHGGGGGAIRSWSLTERHAYWCFHLYIFDFSTKQCDSSTVYSLPTRFPNCVRLLRYTL